MKLAICSSSEKIGTTNWNLTVPLIHKTYVSKHNERTNQSLLKLTWCINRYTLIICNLPSARKILSFPWIFPSTTQLCCAGATDITVYDLYSGSFINVSHLSFSMSCRYRNLSHTKTKCKKKVETERTLETQPVTKSVISKQCRKLESNDTTGNKRLMTCKQYIL